jgi:acetyl esterase/lipase
LTPSLSDDFLTILIERSLDTRIGGGADVKRVSVHGAWPNLRAAALTTPNPLLSLDAADPRDSAARHTRKARLEQRRDPKGIRVTTPLYPHAAVLGLGPLPWRDHVVIEAKTSEKARTWAADAMSDAPCALPAQVAAEQIELAGPAGMLRGRVYWPCAATPIGTVLCIRGGGFVLGSLETERAAGPLAIASEETERPRD